jgi:hypothetical protein
VDLINTWSLKIAEQTVPDEIDLAPVMVQAFIAGGKAREDLFRQEENGTLGGFGAGAVLAIFPWILNTISAVAPILSSMLAATAHINDFLAIVKNVLEILKKKEAKLLPGNPYAPLKRAADAISKELQAVPMQQDQRDLIVYHILYALLEDPMGATQYVQKMGEVANG